MTDERPGRDAGVDQVLDHDFDGIQEFDNRLPNWWLLILYATIVFSLGYWLWFHTLRAGHLPADSYRLEMAQAAEAQLARASAGGVNDESLLLMAQIPARIDEGRVLFGQYCVACHGANGEGLVGPNLTDAFWLHGGRPMDIHRVVTDGVPTKGMAAWGAQLGPRRVEAVVAYVLTIRGTQVPGKAAQGEELGPRPEQSAAEPAPVAAMGAVADSVATGVTSP